MVQNQATALETLLDMNTQIEQVLYLDSNDKLTKKTYTSTLLLDVALESVPNVKNVSNLPPISFSGTASRLCGLCIFATWTEK